VRFTGIAGVAFAIDAAAAGTCVVVAAATIAGQRAAAGSDTRITSR
jgi:hypothetical protein